MAEEHHQKIKVMLEEREKEKIEKMQKLEKL